MAKIKSDDIRPGDAILVEIIVDSVEIRADNNVVFKDVHGRSHTRVRGMEVDGTKAAMRPTTPPIPPQPAPGAPAFGATPPAVA